MSFAYPTRKEQAALRETIASMQETTAAIEGLTAEIDRVDPEAYRRGLDKRYGAAWRRGLYGAGWTEDLNAIRRLWRGRPEAER